MNTTITRSKKSAVDDSSSSDDVSKITKISLDDKDNSHSTSKSKTTLEVTTEGANKERRTFADDLIDALTDPRVRILLGQIFTHIISDQVAIVTDSKLKSISVTMKSITD